MARKRAHQATTDGAEEGGGRGFCRGHYEAEPGSDEGRERVLGEEEAAAPVFSLWFCRHWLGEGRGTDFRPGPLFLFSRPACGLAPRCSSRLPARAPRLSLCP